MKTSRWFIGVAMLVAVPSATLGTDTNGVGIVKGTITSGGKPIAGAVVSIEGLSKEQVKTRMSLYKPRKRTIDQRNLKFIPRVVAIMVGESIDFPNNDKSWHNVYSSGGANDFDLGLYPPGKTRSQKFDKPGVSRILCNAHPNMEAFVVVKGHPFFAVTDGRGNYRIENVPVDRVRVQIWHPDFDVRHEAVEIVRDGEVFGLDVELKKH